MDFTYVALLAGAAVLVPAIFGFGHARSYAMVGFVCLILGGAVVMATPTPSGYDENQGSDRPLITATAGQRVSAVLMVAGAFGLVGAYMVSGRP